MAGKTDMRNMFRFTWPVTVPSKNNGSIRPLDDNPHQTIIPGKLTVFSTKTCGLYAG